MKLIRKEYETNMKRTRKYYENIIMHSCVRTLPHQERADHLKASGHVTDDQRNSNVAVLYSFICCLAKWVSISRISARITLERNTNGRVSSGMALDESDSCRERRSYSLGCK